MFLARLNRLTLRFSKNLWNLEAAFAVFAAYYDDVEQTRKPGKSSKKRSSDVMMAGVRGHVSSFDELFAAVLEGEPAMELTAGILIGVLAGVLAGVVVVVVGLALPSKSCPQCGAKFPIIRKPANRRQGLWGGATCAKCGCEVDRKGRKVP